MNKIVFLAVVSFFLCSCVSKSDVTSIGKDTYMIAMSSNAPGEGGGNLKAKLAQDGSVFCDKQNKHFMLVSFSSADMAFGRTASADITFRCLLENDPEYVRPNAKQEQSPGGNVSSGVLLNIK